MNALLFTAGFLVFSIAAFAGDLDTLPENEGAFREKIDAFIKPGSNTKDAVSLLETYRFKCEELKKQKNIIWCHRSDGGALASVIRRYQFTLQTEGASVKQVKTSTGLVGP